MEFKTNKGKKIEELKIDGKDIFINLNTANLIKFSSLTKNDVSIEVVQEIINTICDEESANLILHLDLEDFINARDILVK